MPVEALTGGTVIDDEEHHLVPGITRTFLDYMSCFLPRIAMLKSFNFVRFVHAVNCFQLRTQFVTSETKDELSLPPPPVSFFVFVFNYARNASHLYISVVAVY